MHKVVVFKPITARIEWCKDPKEYASRTDCLIDPDLSEVENHPMEYWKKQGDQVVVMDHKERDHRNKLILESMCTPFLEEHSPQFKQYERKIDAYTVAAAAVFAGALIYTILKNV